MATMMDALRQIERESCGSVGVHGPSRAVVSLLRAVTRAGNSIRAAKLTTAQRAARPEAVRLGFMDSDGWVTPAGRRVVMGDPR